MSDLLSIGASGVRTYQSALTTVSENIANAGNASYARRTPGIKEVAPASVGLTASGAMTGYGVVQTGINRAADQYKSAAVRASGADLARTETGSVWLDRIQSAMTGADLTGSLTGFFNAAKGVAADPTSSTPRAVLLEKATTVAGAFTATGNALAQVTADLDASADEATAKLDSLSAALAKVNEGLGRAGTNSATAASLADQRDTLLEQMSAIVDVSATFDAAGRATVRAGGTNGPVLVAGTEAGNVTYVRNAAGAVSFAVQRDGLFSALTPNGGALGGVADAAQRIADARDTLNGVATDFVTGVNAIQADGRDLNGVAGAALFAQGAAPTDMTLVLADPAGIAAAAVAGGTRDNSNIVRLDALNASAGFGGKVTTLVAGNAAAIESRKTVAAAQNAIHDGAVTARDAVSGVDLDSEAVELLRFQQAYSASSRIIQVARETFQSLMDIR